MNSRRRAPRTLHRHPADVARQKLRGGGYPRIANVILHGTDHPELEPPDWTTPNLASLYDAHLPYALPIASWLAGELVNLTRPEHSTIKDIFDLYTWVDDPDGSMAYLGDIPEGIREAPYYQQLVSTVVHIHSFDRLLNCIVSYAGLSWGTLGSVHRKFYDEILALLDEKKFSNSQEFLDYTGTPYKMDRYMRQLRRKKKPRPWPNERRAAKEGLTQATNKRRRRGERRCKRKTYKRKRPNKLWRRNERVSNRHYGKKKPSP